MTLNDKMKLPSIKELIGIPTIISAPQQHEQHRHQSIQLPMNESYSYNSSPSSRNSSTSTSALSPHLLPSVQLSPSAMIVTPSGRENPLPHIALSTSSYHNPSIPQYSFQQIHPQAQVQHQLHQAPIIIHNHPMHPMLQPRHSFSHGIIPKRKRPRRKANEMVRLYACNYNNCRNSYGTLNHLNAHITFKKHGPKRKPEEFRQIRELYKLKKKLSDSLSNYTPSHPNESRESSPIDAPSPDDSSMNTRSNSDVDPITALLTNSSSSSNQLDEEFIKKNQESIKILTNLSEKLIEEKGEDQLAIFHQQRGYNGYGRYDHTLATNELEKLPLQ